MGMKQVFISKGKVVVEEVPTPTISSNEILVEVKTSCLSVGTEMSGLRSSAVPLWKKAAMQPKKAISAMKIAQSQGVGHVWQLIENRNGAKNPTGYSAAGIVVKVGENIKDFVPGDRVACGGAQYAYHAEYIRVPRNLCVAIPNNISFEEASTVTLGAIALQGVRRAKPTIGECFAVIGLGILGQLTIQIFCINVNGPHLIIKFLNLLSL